MDSETIWEELQSKNRPLKRYMKIESNKILKKVIFEAKDDEKKGNGSDQDSNNTSGENESGSDEDKSDFEQLPEEANDSDDEDDVSDDVESGDDNGIVDDVQSNDDELSNVSGDVGTGRSTRRTVGNNVNVDSEDSETEMEKWLDDFEELEDSHRDKLERLDKKGDRGHKGAIEVAIIFMFSCMNECIKNRN